MALPGWFDSNRARAYPFLTRTVGLPVTGPSTVRNLPTAAIVDAGFIAGPASAFDAVDCVVRLVAVRRSGGYVHFDFVSDAPGLTDVVLTFTVAETAERYTQLFADSDGAEFSDSDSLSDTDCEEPALSGFLVIGDLDPLLQLLADGETLAGEDGAGVTEPAVVQSLDGSYVVGVGVANSDRTRVTAPPGCDEIIWPYEDEAVFVQDSCVTGVILLRAGFNAGVRQDDAGRIVLQAVVGAGAGPVCVEPPLYPGEVPPDGSVLLSGGPACGELLRSINGLGGPRIDLKAGLGVTITADAENHTLVVDADFTGMVGCYTDSDTMSETETV